MNGLLYITSCTNSSKKSTVVEKTDSLAPPVAIQVTNPFIVRLDTCPKPISITIPAGSIKQSNTAQNGYEAQLVQSETKAVDFIPLMRNYTTDDGLALDAIECVYKDKKGCLWFGTAGGGVSRYDGTQFITYTIAQGLANNVVRSIMEDNEGNFWFGTSGGGLSCFDGFSFKNYTFKEGPQANTIWCIEKDRKGNLWLGTYGNGVFCYNGKTFKNYTTADGLIHNLVLNIKEDKKGNIWFATADGISRYNGTSFTNFSKDDGLVGTIVKSITEDKKGRLWFGTEGGGVSCYDYKKTEQIHETEQKKTNCFTNYNKEHGLESNFIQSVFEDKNGDMWFGTKGNGAICYNGMSFVNYTTAHGLGNNNISCIAEDETGNIWFGSSGGGVTRYDNKSFINYTTKQGLGNNIIYSIGKDKNENMWFGTDNGGVSCYNGTHFTNYTKTQGLPSNVIRSIEEDQNGYLWFGTNGSGISKFDGNIVEAIEKQKKAELKTLSNSKKTNERFFKTFTNYGEKQGVSGKGISCIKEDKEGTLWLGTFGEGVFRYDGKTITNFTTTQGLSSNVIWNIIEDKAGSLWISTDGNGVSKYNGTSFINYTTAQGIADNFVFSMVEDIFGNIWFATFAGVSRYDGERFTNYTVEDGLPDAAVSQVAIDSQQNVIIGTNQGLALLTSFQLKPGHINMKSIVPPQNSLKSLELKKYKPNFEVFNTSTGYPVKDVMAGHNTMLVDSKGIIWIGTGSDKTALVRFDYSAVNKNKKRPEVFIQSIKIDNTVICWNDLLAKQELKNDSSGSAIPPHIMEEVTSFGRELNVKERDTMRTQFCAIHFDSITKFYPLPVNLVLPYNHNNITFDFAAIEPARPYLISYQYMLEGYDKNWSSATNKPTAVFGNMGEGTYTFKVKAHFNGISESGAEGWSEPVAYTFKVLPPWWRTWWFLTLLCVMGIGLIISIFQYRTKALRQRQKELEQTVVERTTEVVLQKDKAEKQKELADSQRIIAEELRSIAEKQKELVQEKQKEILDSITYAKRIQSALLTSDEYINKHLPAEHFILFKPKDIVSGDFYWAISVPFLPGWDLGTNKVKLPHDLKRKNTFYIVTADCTGHGVPGAFMSMLNISYLNENIVERSIRLPHDILNSQRKEIIQALNPPGSIEESKDGMDCVLCAYDFDKMLLHFAAANNSLWLIREGTLTEYKADKMPVGKYNEVLKSFTLQTIALQKGDIVYTSTDGFIDQFGTNGKKLLKKHFKEELIKICHLPMTEQKEYLNNFFESWKGNNEQVDDVCVVGIRI